MRTKPEYPCSSDEVNLTTCSRSQDEDEKTKKKKTSEAIDITAAAMARHPALVLYKRALKLSLDWAVHRNLWRGQAVYIRSLFEANRHVRNPHDQRVLLQETEKLLEKWKHPDPYRAPTAPGGSKWERNLPVPVLNEPQPQHLAKVEN
ncbi:hypothetical protein A7C99_2512 [Trichophyton rubrum]|nr:hypothetical protein HL42_5566 [Trichophyton rubrum]OAL65416.1 hypothetical protein A7C99_2512 [Trichophyton rubrum]OAL71715.1 hypothetical protein A7D00_3744 [Trichophyton violaceum]